MYDFIEVLVHRVALLLTKFLRVRSWKLVEHILDRHQDYPLGDLPAGSLRGTGLVLDDPNRCCARTSRS